MITGVILAGGLNRRMGGKLKALLPIQGQPLIIKQLNEMKKICKQIILVSNEPEKLLPWIEKSPDVDVQCIKDFYVQQGPLSGIHAASLAATEPLMWIVGCDMPFISAQAAQAMGKLCQEANVDAVVPVIEGRTHPLHAVYTRLIGSEAELLLKQEKFRLMGLLDHIDWQPVEEEFFDSHHIAPHFAANINTPEEYENMLVNLSSP
ncbi:putative molybdenum cofactor guanylyltransferase [Paenibacillus marchantiophytorum]|uniref:Probable molybdenum cofactor guanylyltransferase n=1 Tax=Paenibacillus marchantiophytorum TaxID=1619310 RepID=A0ABQ1FDJ0_9BACL|nr:molybdenum cofactor guanylyltransferase [Paenibacillus marchantiophytorum]GGA07097.1 putative molybdenum cofactor guanylyltransferase [Paenibacillus marchantiophytorum]